MSVLAFVLSYPELGVRVRVRYHELRLGSTDKAAREDAVARLLEIGRPAIDEVYPEVVATEMELLTQNEDSCRIFVGHFASRTRFPSAFLPQNCDVYEIERTLLEDAWRPRPPEGLIIVHLRDLNGLGPTLVGSHTTGGPSAQYPIDYPKVMVPLEGEPQADAILEAVTRRLASMKRKP